MLPSLLPRRRERAAPRALRAAAAALAISFVRAAAADDPPPNATVDKLVVTSMTPTHVSMTLHASLRNVPKGTRPVFRGEVAVANVPVPVLMPVAVSLKPTRHGGEATFFLELPLAKVPEAVVARIGNAAIDPSLNGYLTGDGDSKVPVCAVGVLRFGSDQIVAPASNASLFARFGGARLAGLSLRQTTGEAKAILVNPFSFDLGLKEIRYALFVKGKKLAEGEKRGVLIRAGRETELAIPVTVSNADLVAAAGSAILAGGTLEGRLVGTIAVKAGRDQLTVPIDLPGKVDLAR